MTTSIILAGGLGTRLKSVVSDVPKPMAPINGKPFLEYQMDYWIAQGIHRFILSVGYRRECIINHFGRQYRNAIIEYAIEETPLGTGGGLLQASQLLTTGQPFLVMNGDTFFNVSLVQLQQKHAASHSGWTMALFKADMPDRYGKVSCSADGHISSFISGNAMTGDYANGGVYLITPEILNNLPWKAGDNVSLEKDVLPEYIARGGSCYGMLCEGQFLDIGVPEDYHKAASILAVE